MEKFSEYEQKQILGTKEMLARFKSGEDIERIFNTIRPKYPIRKYVDLFGKMSKNLSDIENMKYKSLKEATKKEIEVVKAGLIFMNVKILEQFFMEKIQILNMLKKLKF